MQNQDIRHLDLLGTFHYVLGGLTALFSCFPFIHLFIGISLLSGELFGEQIKGEPPPDMFAWLFIILAIVFILSGWALSVCMFIAGSRLKQRRSRVFCMVIAGIECTLMPFGTILGVFTLVTLNKESVMALFEKTNQTVTADMPASNTP